MAKKKSKQRRSKSEPNRNDESVNQKSKTGGATLPSAEKKHLSPAIIAGVFLGAVAVFGIIAWVYLNQDTDDEIGDYSNVVNQNQNLNSSSGRSGERTWLTADDHSQSWAAIDNAEDDGWNSEVVTDQVMTQLNKIKKALNTQIDSESLSGLVAEDASIGRLLPAETAETYRNVSTKVVQGNIADQPEAGTGSSGLASALEEVVQVYADPQKLRLKLKVFRINRDGDRITTRQTFEAFGQIDGGLREENAIWESVWTNEASPKLTSLSLVSHEAVERQGGQMFTDHTLAAFGSNPSFEKQLLIGYDWWLERSQAGAFNMLGNNGIAIADINQDGLDDIYLCQETGLPNLLYLQNEDGTLREFSEQSQTNYLQNSTTALFVDLNNDGLKDLAVAVNGGVVVSQGLGDGRFELRHVIDSSDYVWSLTAVDYDLDGDLDLYMGAYNPDGIIGETEDVIVSSSADGTAIGGNNNLFQNNIESSNWMFTDVTATTGLDKNNGRYTFAASWEDVDNDGDQDLYVANDFGWNNLYRNDQSAEGAIQFVDIADESNAKDNAFGMSVAWGDYDRDGWMDVYVSNMFSYAGNRIITQNQFKSDESQQVKDQFLRYAGGNTLLRNVGLDGDNAELNFEDDSLARSVNQGRWAWGSTFVDHDNDGWQDLFVANGYITAGDSGDL